MPEITVPWLGHYLDNEAAVRYFHRGRGGGGGGVDTGLSGREGKRAVIVIFFFNIMQRGVEGGIGGWRHDLKWNTEGVGVLFL